MIKKIIATMTVAANLMALGLVSFSAYAEEVEADNDPEISAVIESAPEQGELIKGVFSTLGELPTIQLNTVDGPAMVGARGYLDVNDPKNLLSVAMAVVSPDQKSVKYYRIPARLQEFADYKQFDAGVIIKGQRMQETESEYQLLEVVLVVQLLNEEGSLLENIVTYEMITKVIKTEPKE